MGVMKRTRIDCNDSYILPQSLNTHTYDIRTHTHTHTTHIRGMSDGFRGMLMMVLLLYERERVMWEHTQREGYTHCVGSSGVALPSDSPPPPVWAEHL